MKKRSNENKIVPALLLLIFLCGAIGTPLAKTRWSSLHLIPDADFLAGGHYVVDVQGYYFNDSAKGTVIRPTALLNFGIMEWVNLEMGYAGGVTLGFKARLINEDQNYLPSLAIGARSIVSGKEANYFNSKDSTMNNALYCALGKNIDPLRLRIHAGIQTLPGSSTDKADPFFGLEEYFGNGLYATIELERLKKAFWPSLFVSWRILDKKLEFSAGAVAINRLFFDKNNKFSVNLTSSDSSEFVHPGLWMGIRYHGFLRTGKNHVFSSIDDHVKVQGEQIEVLQKQIDSLKTTLSENLTRMAKVDNSIIMLSDSIYSDRNRLKAALYDKLIALKILYESEPFEPEQAKQAINRIVAIKANALPIMKEFVVDKKQDRKIRLLGISLIGEMGGTGASDALLDVLSQSEDPDIKIEILIALGKMKETRALYVMEQLANDPTDVVAFTAQEVLARFVKESGVKLSPDFKMRPVTMSDTSIIREEKIPVQRTKKADEGKGKDTLAKAPDKAPASDNKAAPGLGSAPIPAAKAVKGQPLDSASEKKLDTLKTEVSPQSEKGGQDGGVQPAGKDSTTAVKADSVSAKTVVPAPAKKDEKPLSNSDKKKQKKSEKKSSSASPKDEKNW